MGWEGREGKGGKGNEKNTVGRVAQDSLQPLAEVEDRCQPDEAHENPAGAGLLGRERTRPALRVRSDASCKGIHRNFQPSKASLHRLRIPSPVDAPLTPGAQLPDDSYGHVDAARSLPPLHHKDPATGYRLRHELR